MRSVKAIRFVYNPTPETRELLRIFRTMVNDAIRIGLGENIRGRFSLRNRIYREFKQRYGVQSCYPYSVAEVAWSIVKKHRRWHRRPSASRLRLKMESAKYSLNYGILSLPNKPGRRILIPLQYGDYQRSFLTDASLKRGSVTITDSAVLIAFSKETPASEPLKRLATTSTTSQLSAAMILDLTSRKWRGSTPSTVLDGLSSIRGTMTTGGSGRSSLAPGEKERIKQMLSRISKQIVEKAFKNREAIVLERLKGIRKAHQKGDGSGRDSRRRANLWPFRQLQDQIAYKAAWLGVQVEYINPRNTSKECANCHYVNKALKVTERSWQCPQCGCQLDRDLNAAVNIERRGKIPCLGEVRPGARGTDEAMKGNETTTPVLRAEAPKLGVRPLCPNALTELTTGTGTPT